MYNPEHHLHDMQLIRTVMKKLVFNYLLKYGFSEGKSKTALKLIDYERISYSNEDLELEFGISKREGYEIILRKTTWPVGAERYIDSFKGLLENRITELREFAKPYYDKGDQIDKYSEDWYYNYMKYDLEFLIKFFPQVLENNDLGMFENDIFNRQ